jgi:hypothetical protein
MKTNPNNTIHCFWCNKDYGLDGIFLNVLFETSISCPQNHIVGYTYDPEWLLLIANCPYFYLYHHRGQCRCVQDETDCQGNDENCNFILGRKCYGEYLNE